MLQLFSLQFKILLDSFRIPEENPKLLIFDLLVIF